MDSLPRTGTTALLEALSPHVDDDFINSLVSAASRQRAALFVAPVATVSDAAAGPLNASAFLQFAGRLA